MRTTYILYILASISLALQSCKKEEPDPTPEIEFVSLSATEVVEFQNQITLVINYKDANGDLGTVDPDELTLKIKDARLSNYDWYHVPPLTPELQELEIEGTLNIQLNPLFILGNGQSESTELSIQIRDRELNWSNQIITPTILIRDSI